MPRPLTGHVIECHLDDGRTAFDVKIRGRKVRVGHTPEWSRGRVQRLLDNRLVPRARLNEPWWEEIDGVAKASPAQAEPVTFEEVASSYVDRIKGRYSNEATLNACLSPVMKHVGPFFAYDGEELRTVEEISGGLVSAFTQTKRQEREALCDLADTLAELNEDLRRDPDLLRAQLDSDEHWQLLVRYGQRGGRLPLAQGLGPEARGLISLSTRGLSNNEINRCLARLRDVLDIAREDFRVDIGDPTRKRSLPRTDPPRSWLRPFQLEAIFDAAAELDARKCASGGPDYRHLGRRPLVVLLGLGGPRVSEVGAAQWDDAHLDAREPILRIPESKTSAGRRDLRLHPMVRDALVERRAALSPEGSDPIFATATGEHRDRHSIRTRILAPVLERAEQLLKARKLPPLPDRVTPHTFRRTYLTYLAWAEVPMKRAMSQAGHKDAKLTLEIYQQDFPDDPYALEQVREWLGLTVRVSSTSGVNGS